MWQPSLPGWLNSPAAWIALAWLCSLTAGGAAMGTEGPREAALPPGIGVLWTSEGPVFTDPAGMTLYVTLLDAKPGQSQCNDVHYREARGPRHPAGGPVPDADRRRSCAQKWPPLLAAADAAPSGRWSLLARSDGTRQWAYDGKPLYRSIRDQRPGERNGEIPRDSFWSVAAAPLADMPAGLTAVRTRIGLVTADHSGHTLYVLPDGIGCADACAAQWHAVPAPAGVGAAIGDWRALQRNDGTIQWAFRGRPVFRFAGDVSQGEVNGLAQAGADLIPLAPPPGHPEEVTEQDTIDGRYYADRQGKILYRFICNEETPDRLACHDVGDSPVAWRSACGGDARCSATWHPLAAPPGAEPIDGIWSVMRIDPANPLVPVQGPNAGVAVWAFKGSPVFTYARDLAPGDLNGTGNFTPWFAIHVFGDDGLM
jgi:predicted lipoprotein with Yx(FWY)xxD motif